VPFASTKYPTMRPMMLALNDVNVAIAHVTEHREIWAAPAIAPALTPNLTLPPEQRGTIPRTRDHAEQRP
jgi:hypothetical protein